MEKKELKFRAIFLLIIILLIVLLTVRKLFVEGYFDEKSQPVQTENTKPAAPSVPTDPRGEKIVFSELPTQDTTVVFKLAFLEEINSSEIRNLNNAVMIWKSKVNSTFQVILRDKYPDWSPTVKGGVFKLKNGKTLTVRFENEPRPDNFPAALDPNAFK